MESQYDLDIPYQIEQFVCSDKAVAERLAGSRGESDTQRAAIGDELVFIQQDNNTLEFTVYVDEALLSSVDDNAECELDNLCTVVEGASHALCLLWHAHHDRQIRPIDLELQAEIDKFMILVDNQRSRVGRRDLHRRLFANSRYVDEPGTELFERYQTATKMASRYCQWLETQFLKDDANEQLTQELARFYRLSGRAKFDRINQLH